MPAVNQIGCKSGLQSVQHLTVKRENVPLYHRMSRARVPLERQSFNQEYVSLLAQGDPDTACHFTRYFSGLLVVKLRAKLRSPQMAEDAAQETLYRVLRIVGEKGGIDHPERLGAFVNSVCDNVVLEFFRAGSRFQQVPENASEPVDQAFSAEVNCITNERKKLLRKALKLLRKNDQTIIERVFLNEEDKDQICQDLGIDRNYLRVQVHRALARFRSVLTGLHDPSAPESEKKAANG